MKRQRIYKVLSLFSGIGGLCHHSIAIAGLQKKFIVSQFVEISKYAQKELSTIAPHTPIHKDITTYKCHPNQFQVCTGGFPCSGTSAAGKKLGLKDPRSSLWSEQFRIIKECRPTFILVENVFGLLHRGLNRVIADLDSIGIVGEWDCISAYEVGLPHDRKRIFIVGYPNRLQFSHVPTPWTNQIGEDIETLRELEGRRIYQPGVPTVASRIPIGVPQRIKGNFEARRAYGLSCSPRQAAIAWQRINYLTTILK